MLLIHVYICVPAYMFTCILTLTYMHCWVSTTHIHTHRFNYEIAFTVTYIHGCIHKSYTHVHMYMCPQLCTNSCVCTHLYSTFTHLYVHIHRVISTHRQKYTCTRTGTAERSSPSSGLYSVHKARSP